MYSKCYLLFFLIRVLFLVFTSSVIADPQLPRERDPRLTVINVYSGLDTIGEDEERDVLGHTALLEDEDDEDDEEDEDKKHVYSPVFSKQPEKLLKPIIPTNISAPFVRKHEKTYMSGSSTLSAQKRTHFNKNTFDRHEAKQEERYEEEERKQSRLPLKEKPQKNKSFITPNLKSDSIQIKNKFGLNEHRNSQMNKEFFRNNDGFWPKSYNWNSFRKVIGLLNEMKH